MSKPTGETERRERAKKRGGFKTTAAKVAHEASIAAAAKATDDELAALRAAYDAVAVGGVL